MLLSDYAKFRSQFYSKKALNHLSNRFPTSKLFLTHSATGALEMIAQTIGIQPGDEIILPSFTFVSTVNAFVSFGAVPVFVDIDPVSKCIDVEQVSRIITPKTKIIIAVHYGGIPANLLSLKGLCKKHALYLIEDAAMGYGSFYGDQPLGSIGDAGIISFDITKQVTAIQGGLCIINNTELFEKANQVYHIGTNREEHINGNVPYYEWVNKGSKFQMSELNAAVLVEQLTNEEQIFQHRKGLSLHYYTTLKPLADAGLCKLIPEWFISNSVHLFYVETSDLSERNELMTFLMKKNIESCFHYIPLHSSKFGKEIGKTSGEMSVTDHTANTLLRLPFHNLLNEESVQRVTNAIKEFYNGRK